MGFQAKKNYRSNKKIIFSVFQTGEQKFMIGRMCDINICFIKSEDLETVPRNRLLDMLNALDKTSIMCLWNLRSVPTSIPRSRAVLQFFIWTLLIVRGMGGGRSVKLLAKHRRTHLCTAYFMLQDTAREHNLSISLQY